MGYCNCMGYCMHFPANQLGRLKKVWASGSMGCQGVWGVREYWVSGSMGVWVIEAINYEGVDCKSTVIPFSVHGVENSPSNV